jgi:hypothetical protein
MFDWVQEHQSAIFSIEKHIVMLKYKEGDEIQIEKQEVKF